MCILLVYIHIKITLLRIPLFWNVSRSRWIIGSWLFEGTYFILLQWSTLLRRWKQLRLPKSQKPLSTDASSWPKRKKIIEHTAVRKSKLATSVLLKEETAPISCFTYQTNFINSLKTGKNRGPYKGDQPTRYFMRGMQQINTKSQVSKGANARKCHIYLQYNCLRLNQHLMHRLWFTDGTDIYTSYRNVMFPDNNTVIYASTT